MKYLDEKLIDARAETDGDNDGFIGRTMNAVQQAHARETFSGAVRTKKVTKKEKFMTKLLTMPRLATAALSIGAVLFVGGVTYAAVNWFDADVSTNQKANTVSSVAAKCSPSQVQALQDNKLQTNTSEYKILKPELISEHDLQLDELSTCEQRAIEGSVRAAMPGVYQPGDSHDGLYYPVGSYGTVVSATASTITVADIPVYHAVGEPEMITTTLTSDTRTLVTDKGRATDLTAFKPGDHVYVIFQNPVRPGQDDNDWRATPSAQSTVRAIAKTQYDFVAIKEKMFKAAGEGAFEVVKKSDAYGG